MIRAPNRHGDDLQHKSKSKIALLMVRYRLAFDAANEDDWAAAMEKARQWGQQTLPRRGRGPRHPGYGRYFFLAGETYLDMYRHGCILDDYL